MACLRSCYAGMLTLDNHFRIFFFTSSSAVTLGDDDEPGCHRRLENKKRSFSVVFISSRRIARRQDRIAALKISITFALSPFFLLARRDWILIGKLFCRSGRHVDARKRMCLWWMWETENQFIELGKSVYRARFINESPGLGPEESARPMNGRDVNDFDSQYFSSPARKASGSNKFSSSISVMNSTERIEMEIRLSM